MEYFLTDLTLAACSRLKLVGSVERVVMAWVLLSRMVRSMSTPRSEANVLRRLKVWADFRKISSLLSLESLPIGEA